MSDLVTIRCERCMGTGALESSDSTDDGWWDCPLCKGTGQRTIQDRRVDGDENKRLRAVIDRAYALAQEMSHDEHQALVCVIEALEPAVTNLP